LTSPAFLQSLDQQQRFFSTPAALSFFLDSIAGCALRACSYKQPLSPKSYIKTEANLLSSFTNLIKKNIKESLPSRRCYRKTFKKKPNRTREKKRRA